ncbi:MAG: nitroreductase family protein [Deferribacterales bacterium]
MIDFKVDQQKCTSCGACVNDCPAMIIEMDGKLPVIREENESKCYKCQHCMTVCPTAAVSILGFQPENSVPDSMKASYEQFDALARNRRTVRKFKKGNVAKDKIDKIIKAAANAPTGKNARQVMLTLLDDEKQMDAFKELLISKIEKADAEGRLTGPMAAFATRAKLFRAGKDFIFRNAPHMMLATCPKSAPTPAADPFIALSYAELAAYTLNVGVIWGGFVMYLFDLFPETAQELGVPEDHMVAYVLLFGESGQKYFRGAQRDDITLNRPLLN